MYDNMVQNKTLNQLPKSLTYTAKKNYALGLTYFKNYFLPWLSVIILRDKHGCLLLTPKETEKNLLQIHRGCQKIKLIK